MQLQVGSPLAQLWEHCHCDAGAPASQGGTARPPAVPPQWLVLLQGQRSAQTHSAAVNWKPAAKSAPLASATPVKEQPLAVFWVGFQGWFFTPRKTVTCNYTAVQITAKAGIRKHRKAVTQCIMVRYALSQNFKILKKILNVTEGQNGWTAKQFY